MNYPKVSIILLNWNGWKYTVDCLESLLKAEAVDFEVVLVDNGSTDDSIKMIEEWIVSHGIPESRFSLPAAQKLAGNGDGFGGRKGMRRIILFSLPENLGFCAGNNLGLKQAQVNDIPYALILNNDTLVDPNFLSPIVEYADAHPEAGLIEGQIRYADDPGKIWHMGDQFSWQLGSRNIYFNRSTREAPAEPFFTGWISGCMALMPLSVFSKIGGYDEKLFLFCEDWDLSLRAIKFGYKLAVVPSSIIYHKVSKTLGKTSPFVYYYSGRNLFLLWNRYLPKWRAYLLSAAYLPYKFFKAVFFTIKYKKPYYIFFTELVFDAAFGRYGKWRRHDKIAADMKKKRYGN
ncbi:MAG: glycosyltransferase family 2 protein [Candidatus Paceibacterota bacterium]|jgi:hypothetical protein